MLQHTHKIFDVFYLFFCCISSQSHGAIHKQSHNENCILGVLQHSPVSDNYILGTEILIKAFYLVFFEDLKFVSWTNHESLNILMNTNHIHKVHKDT